MSYRDRDRRDYRQEEWKPFTYSKQYVDKLKDEIKQYKDKEEKERMVKEVDAIMETRLKGITSNGPNEDIQSLKEEVKKLKKENKKLKTQKKPKKLEYDSDEEVGNISRPPPGFYPYQPYYPPFYLQNAFNMPQPYGAYPAIPPCQMNESISSTSSVSSTSSTPISKSTTTSSTTPSTTSTPLTSRKSRNLRDVRRSRIVEESSGEDTEKLDEDEVNEITAQIQAENLAKEIDRINKEVGTSKGWQSKLLTMARCMGLDIKEVKKNDRLDVITAIASKLLK